MKTVSELIKERNTLILAEFTKLYKPGMKKGYVCTAIATKHKLTIPTVVKIVGNAGK